MSWVAVARNDLRGAVRSNGTRVLAAAFLLAFLGLVALLVRVDAASFDAYLDLLAPGIALLLPLVGVVLGYDAVVGERESGTAALALSLPHSRAELVAGKVAGGTAVLAGSLAVATLAAGLAMLPWFTDIAPLRLLLFALAATVYGAVFLALSTALSMSFESSRKVIGGAFGAYLALVLFWNELVNVLVVILFRFRGAALLDPPTWATLAKFLSPRTAFGYLVADTLDAGSPPPLTVEATAEFVTPAVAAAALLAWVLVPLFLGYLRFARGDL